MKIAVYYLDVTKLLYFHLAALLKYNFKMLLVHSL